MKHTDHNKKFRDNQRRRLAAGELRCQCGACATRLIVRMPTCEKCAKARRAGRETILVERAKANRAKCYIEPYACHAPGFHG